MGQGFAVREFASGDEPGVLALLNAALGDGRGFDRTTAFFTWKHLENPFGRSLLLLAESEKIVGLRALMRWDFRVGEQVVRAVRAVDTATHEAVRRQGVFSSLTRSGLQRAREEGIAFVFNTPNPQSLSGYLKLGWRDVGRADVLIRPLRPLRMAAALLRRRAPALSPEAAAGPAPPRPVAELLAHAAAVQSLIEQDGARGRPGYQTRRSLDFLRWRYAAAPGLTYFADWADEDPSGAAVIYRFNRRRGLREVLLCELLLPAGGTDRARRLLRRWLRRLPADYVAAHTSRGLPHWRLLRSVGFVPIPAGPRFVVRPLGEGPDRLDPTNRTNWHLSIGDLEIF